MKLGACLPLLVLLLCVLFCGSHNGCVNATTSYAPGPDYDQSYYNYYGPQPAPDAYYYGPQPAQDQLGGTIGGTSPDPELTTDTGMPADYVVEIRIDDGGPSDFIPDPCYTSIYQCVESTHTLIHIYT